MAEIENIYTRLMAIQSELDVPKKRFNKYAKPPFYYRNAEDILAAAKPICHKHGCLLLLTDTIKMIGQRYYVEATATLTDGKENISVTASAREEEVRKGFDGSQITGSASSYARKYALNGLLSLDDAADPDSGDNAAPPPDSYQQAPPQQAQIICPRCGRPVQGVTGNSGKHYTAEQIFNKYGMCGDCHAHARAQAKQELQAAQNGGQ